MMSTLKFQLWGIFFRESVNLDEELDNIMFTVFNILVMPLAMILMIAGFYHSILWLGILGTLLFLYTIGRFIMGLVNWP